MQVQKEAIRIAILKSAEIVFYQKDYRSAKLLEIAQMADIPVGLIYTYFKNKETLFEEIVTPIYGLFFDSLKAEESLKTGDFLERFEKVGKDYLYKLLDNHRKFVILVDKSFGTKYQNTKEQMIAKLEQHISLGLKRYTNKKYDPLLTHILATNYTEGILEIARHYQGKKWAEKMLDTLNQCYYKGTNSL